MADLFSVRSALTRAAERAVRQVRRVLAAAVGRGTPADAVATQLSQYVNPWYATRRAPTGGLRRAGRVGIAPSAPAGSGMASAGARAIGLDAVNAAHGDRLIVLAQRAPGGVLVAWTLAPGHRDADECDAKARDDVGFGPGVYPPRQVPRYPSHPRCRCRLAAVPVP